MMGYFALEVRTLRASLVEHDCPIWCNNYIVSQYGLGILTDEIPVFRNLDHNFTKINVTTGSE